MKIIELQAENVKRLRAVDITPDGTLQVIGGRNAQGKSSLIEGIWMALGGRKATKDTTRPIRDGEDRAMVRLDLGDMVITRTWTPSGSKLKVENTQGVPARSPQALLDNLIGRMSFDPLDFIRLAPKEQRNTLLDIVELEVNIDEVDTQIGQVYAMRTEIGREGTALGEVSVDPSLPVTEQSLQDTLARLRAAEEANRQVQNQSDILRRAEDNVAMLEENMQRLLAQLEEAKNEVSRLRSTAQAPLVDTSALEAELSDIDGMNARIRSNNEAIRRSQRREELLLQYEGATQELQRLSAVKADALRKAKFPIEGLSFTDAEVLYHGVPLSQASSAEQIQVSMAIGMALNPQLRVLMIKDGSLLDDTSMEAIYRQAADSDFQLFVERVGNADRGAVIIEDGEVVAINGAA